MKIPKIIWQTFKTKNLKPFIKKYQDTWIKNNPDFEYRFYDDNDIIVFIKKEYPEYLKYYNKINIGAVKSDFWRLLVLLKYGGIYADLDSFCNKPLNQLIKENDTYITCIHDRFNHCQHFCLICEPNHYIIKEALKKSIENIEKTNGDITKLDFIKYYGFIKNNNQIELKSNKKIIFNRNKVFSYMGPDVFQEIYEELYFNNKTEFNKIKFCSNMNFDNFIIHQQPKKWGKYLKSIGTKHYGLIEKFKK